MAGVDRPHVVGNSLRGWVALELARLRPVASPTLLAPAVVALITASALAAERQPVSSAGP